MRGGAPQTPIKRSPTRIDGSTFPNKEATTHRADPAEATQLEGVAMRSTGTHDPHEAISTLRTTQPLRSNSRPPQGHNRH